jgi:hypothetical protein
MKDKLEKLCRELTKENKKVKVGESGFPLFACSTGCDVWRLAKPGILG